MDILKPARDEILALEKTLADAQSRLKDLRAFVDAGERLYGVQAAATAVLKSNESWPLPLAAPPQKPTWPASDDGKKQPSPGASHSKASQIIALVESSLSGGRHMQSKELAGIVQGHGIDLGGDSIGSLSAYLSKSGRFVSERAKGGWALKQQRHKEEPPPDVGASAGA